eukprot:4757553-Amphidinium_carterae.1
MPPQPKTIQKYKIKPPKQPTEEKSPSHEASRCKGTPSQDFLLRKGLSLGYAFLRGHVCTKV